MAVYTEVSDEELREFLTQYDLGEVTAFKGIAEGVENSNYLLRTTSGSFILTLYEKRVAPRDLPYFVGLMEHLASRGINCPIPLRGRDGDSLRKLAGRPAAIITFLDGLSARRIQPQHCRLLGEALAQLHLAGMDFTGHRPNDLSVSGWRPLFEASAERANEVQAGLAETLDKELSLLEAGWPGGLPEGVIHADLFPDNVFFLGERLSGIIDFYFACNDFFAYDMQGPSHASGLPGRAADLGGRVGRPAVARAGQCAALSADPAVRLAEPSAGRPGETQGPARVPEEAELP
jgi:homoserine kinase type II